MPDRLQHCLVGLLLANPEESSNSEDKQVLQGASEKSMRKCYLSLSQHCSLHLEQPLDARANLCLQ